MRKKTNHTHFVGYGLILLLRQHRTALRSWSAEHICPADFPQIRGDTRRIPRVSVDLGRVPKAWRINYASIFCRRKAAKTRDYLMCLSV
jgi:hypothetical protein